MSTKFRRETAGVEDKTFTDGGSKIPIQQILEQVVLDEKSPVQYGAPSRILKYLRVVAPKSNITLQQVTQFVESRVRPRALIAQPPSSKFKRIPYRAWGLGDQLQADLMFVATWKQKNILTVIDVFSRQADAEICHNKMGHNVAAAMRRILKRMKLKPISVQRDQGNEFKNPHFKALLVEYGSHWFWVDSSRKAALVERFNKTLRDRYEVLKRMEPGRSQKSILTQVVRQYNETPHTALKGLAPADITVENNGQLISLSLQDRDFQSVKNDQYQTPFKFEVGAYVGATLDRESRVIRRKVASGTYTDEVFKIISRERKPYQSHINVYKLEDLTGEAMTGIFYEPQLRLAHGFDANRKQIKKVLSKRKWDSVVSLQDYPAKHREVLPNPKRFKRPVNVK